MQTSAAQQESILTKKGINLHSTHCPICDEDVETENHIFVDCSIVHGVWKSIGLWWNLDLSNLINLYDILVFEDSSQIPAKTIPIW